MATRVAAAKEAESSILVCDLGLSSLKCIAMVVRGALFGNSAPRHYHIAKAQRVIEYLRSKSA